MGETNSPSGLADAYRRVVKDGIHAVECLDDKIRVANFARNQLLRFRMNVRPQAVLPVNLRFQANLRPVSQV